mgnify:CR=1 FL=1
MYSFRIAAAARGKRTVPCVLTIVLPSIDADDKAASKAPSTMHLYRAGGRVGA